MEVDAHLWDAITGPAIRPCDGWVAICARPIMHSRSARLCAERTSFSSRSASRRASSIARIAWLPEAPGDGGIDGSRRLPPAAVLSASVHASAALHTPSSKSGSSHVFSRRGALSGRTAPPPPPFDGHAHGEPLHAHAATGVADFTRRSESPKENLRGLLAAALAAQAVVPATRVAAGLAVDVGVAGAGELMPLGSSGSPNCSRSNDCWRRGPPPGLDGDPATRKRPRVTRVPSRPSRGTPAVKR